jgi:O-methyltransferase
MTSSPGITRSPLGVCYSDLKCSLLGLGSHITRTVVRVGVGEDVGIARVEDVPDSDYWHRLAGSDCPAVEGWTMIGWDRLTSLERCVRTILVEDVPGDLIECGVWRGGACTLMRAVLQDDDRLVWAADSFEGFDAEFMIDGKQFLYEHFKVSVDQVRACFDHFNVPTDKVRFLKGWFADTLPTLHDQTWSLIRLDGDSYHATRTTLECLYPNLSPGGFCIIDDYGAVGACQQAVDEFRGDDAPPLQRVDWTGVFWRKPS